MANGLTRNGVKLEPGKTYEIEHIRKGTWTAECISVDEEWAVVSDDSSSPIRLSFFNATLKGA